MICPTCMSQAIENQAGGKTFYYCRDCKEEVYDYPRSNLSSYISDEVLADLTPAEREEFERWLDQMGSNAISSDDGPELDFFDDDLDGCD